MHEMWGEQRGIIYRMLAMWNFQAIIKTKMELILNQLFMPSNNRLKLTAHMAKFLSARSLA